MDGSTESFGVSDPRKQKRNKRCLILSGLLIAAVGIGIGVIIGYFSHPSTSSEPCPKDDPTIDNDEHGAHILKLIKERMNATNIDENLKRYTSYSHLGGTEGEEILGDDLYATWKSQGLDHVTKVTYEVLLSYPNMSDLNYIQLWNGTEEIYKTQLKEYVLSEDQNHTDVVPPFNAYSPAGDVEGLLVYVNYARQEDFENLTSTHNINFTGNDYIAIARYGKIFRGDKVATAAKFGAKAIILYSDPADYSIDLDTPVYPDSWWLPGTGVQRGTTKLGDGDPSTPGYPATASAYRVTDPELPTIPVHPIGYKDAEQFLSRMQGNEAPESWRGKLNITYRLGPGFVGGNMRVKMHIASYNKLVNTSNVFGYIKGTVEPDRYVLMGNHRDAWVFGAVDPTSGTAVMMEVSRVLAELRKNGEWQPRRTIIFCSWGAEEYGLIASYEWVEEQVKILSDRAVAYLNVDLAIEGNASMRAKGTPLLYNILYKVAKDIKSANDDSITMYDEWMNHFPDKTRDVPRVANLGGASDFTAFIGIAGVPCYDVRYSHDFPIIDYPLYHSVYETYQLVKEHMDPQFNVMSRSLAIGQFWAESARYLADTIVLPLNASTFAEMLNKYVADFKSGYGDLMKKNNISLDELEAAAARFQTESNAFMGRLDNVNKSNILDTRMYNDQLMRLERAFIDPAGLPFRPLKKNLLFAPSSFDSYAGDTFPGLTDLMYGIERLGDVEAAAQWEKVKQHLATVIFCVNSATFGLKPVEGFQ